MASAASSEPADGELTKQCSFSKGEWADEYPVDVGFGKICPLFETPENAGFDSLTARELLAVAYAAGECNGRPTRGVRMTHGRPA